MNKKQWLDFLFYEICKQQMPEHEVQYSILKGKEKIFHKRKQTIDLKPEDNFNHRQIFINEIVIDIDEPNENTLKFLERTHMELMNAKINHTIFFTGSRGYHVCIYDDDMFTMTEKQRTQYRENRIEKITKIYDKMLLSGRHLVAMEFCEHWKTGNMKTPLFVYFDDVEINQKLNNLIIIGE